MSDAETLIPPPGPWPEGGAVENPMIPYEDAGSTLGFWGRIGATLRLMTVSPYEFGIRVQTSEDTASPWWFLLFCSIPGWLLGLVFSVVGELRQTYPRMIDGQMVAGRHPGWLFETLGVGGLTGIFSLFLAAAFLPWLVGGLWHALLKLVGGLRPGAGFLQTRRAAAYFMAQLQLLGTAVLVLTGGASFGRFLGPPIGLAAGILAGLGLAGLHGSTRLRCIAAACLPVAFLYGFFYWNSIVDLFRILTRAAS